MQSVAMDTKAAVKGRRKISFAGKTKSGLAKGVSKERVANRK